MIRRPVGFPPDCSCFRHGGPHAPQARSKMATRVRSERLRDSKRLWLPLAEGGDGNAQIMIGGMYADGSGVEQSYRTALDWFQSAADQGNARAQFNLGTLYENGQGTPQSYADALSWFRKAADQGHAGAQYHLALLNAAGKEQPGAPRSSEMAALGCRARRVRRPIRPGPALCKGRWHNPGREALKWATLAANQGHVVAKYNAAIMYADGRGIPKDDKKATEWYRLAADQGYLLAQSTLGLRYLTGLGVQRDMVQAFEVAQSCDRTWRRPRAERP